MEWKGGGKGATHGTSTPARIGQTWRMERTKERRARARCSSGPRPMEGENLRVVGVVGGYLSGELSTGAEVFGSRKMRNSGHADSR